MACRAIHTRQAPCILLKIDITKAFDSVAWNFLLEVLQHVGFGRRWRNWISMVLSTSSTKILLNGHPGRRICHARGLRQGDPLSPMLFVLVMEVLNHCLCWVEQRGHLTPIIGLEGSRVSLYADDLVPFVVPEVRDLEMVKAVLNIFGLASGLFSNLDKSIATPSAAPRRIYGGFNRFSLVASKSSPAATWAFPSPCTSSGDPMNSRWWTK